MWFNVHYVLVSYSSLFLNQGVLENKEELAALQEKLEAIRSIVEKYKKHDGLGALNPRIEQFCEYVGSSFCSYMFDTPLQGHHLPDKYGQEVAR